MFSILRIDNTYSSPGQISGIFAFTTFLNSLYRLTRPIYHSSVIIFVLAFFTRSISALIAAISAVLAFSYADLSLLSASPFAVSLLSTCDRSTIFLLLLYQIHWKN